MDKADRGIEVIKDKTGKILWFGEYIFKRLHKPGEKFIKDSIEYTVISHEIIRYLNRTYHSGSIELIECVVEEK